MKANKIYTILFIFIAQGIFSAEVKLKDIAKVEGIRDNQLTGYGLVVGLPGTGDTKSELTRQSIENYLKKFGITTEIKTNASRNIASVIITANIPSYSKKGDRIHVMVSSIGDARSIEGGILLQSPLKSGNNTIVAVASGLLSSHGLNMDESASRKRNKNTSIIYNGAIVEKDLQDDFFQKDKITITLNEQDFTDQNLIIEALKNELGSQATAITPNQIEVKIPENITNIEFLSRLENLTIEKETRAKVVINERSGTVVMGGNIIINEVAVSKNGLNINVYNTASDQQDKQEHMFMLEDGVNVSDLVSSLNKIGATSKDIIAILQAIKKSGAMNAELVIE